MDREDTIPTPGAGVVYDKSSKADSDEQMPPSLPRDRSTILESTHNNPGTEEISVQPSRPIAKPDEYSRANQMEEGTVIHFFDMKGKFHLDQYLQHMVAAIDAKGLVNPKMGVTWKELTVCGEGSGVKKMSSLSSIFTSFPSISALKHPHLKTILNSFEGDLQPGEMLLVLGRPGAGCTTFLKTLASYRDGFHSVEGKIDYSGLSYHDIEGPYRGEVVYAPEDDIHFPTLTVHQTLSFAAASRTPSETKRIDAEGQQLSRAQYTQAFVDILATILGLKHTYNTKVGNDVIRGVSGGERKRVTVAETLASRAKIALFDNSSRGLDSSTALEFVRSLRIGADVLKVSIAVSIYQAGESLTDLFDKVLVIHEGQQIYFGGIRNAVSYFERLGFQRAPRQTTADFLVACASGEPAAIQLRTNSIMVPTSSQGQREAWLASKEAAELRILVDRRLNISQDADSPHEKDQMADRMIQAKKQDKAKHTRLGSSYTISIPMQVRQAVRRRYQIAIGDPSTLIITAAVSIFQALIIGSVFILLAPNTSNYFSRGGVLFTALLFNSLQSMSEITKGYAQKPIISRHRKLAFIHPAADALADTILDIPMRLLSLIPFIIVLYFMAGLAVSADQFFVFFGILVLTSFTLAAFFRMLAALFKEQSAATMVAGIAVVDMVLYTGYAIPRPSMVIWWKWLSYCNPISFAFEVLITNEFRRLDGTCSQYIPSGPSYESASSVNRVCAIASAQPGQIKVSGPAYLSASYGYTYSHTPRNAGILLGFWIAFVLAHVVASEFQGDSSAKGGIMIFKNLPQKDERATQNNQGSAEKRQEKEVNAAPPDSLRTFTWHDINYDVQIKGITRRLLHNVSGYVAPGTLTALMGPSGAGKTTLLNVLAQRTGNGVVRGSFYIEGRPIAKSFQAATGYCQQQDVHLETQTVREAIRFSALLRQPANVSHSDKVAYVEKVIELLEMQAYAEALVGNVGQGLSLEQRKRLTIAVELAAKPALLLFLDEPTSGLDALAAWSIVRLLRKLADSGQAILCTIHQPSGELFSQFDRLLLLQKGGETVFFGDIGENSNKVVGHFEHLSGRTCDAATNPAEFVLDVIAAGATGSLKVDWHKAYLTSSHGKELSTHLATHQSNRPEIGVETEVVKAATLLSQFRYYLIRIFVHYWRSPQYIVSKVMLNMISGLFIGSSFWGQGSASSTTSLENKIFAIFMSLIVSSPLAQQLQPVFFKFRSLFEVREKPSKMYAWPVMVISCILVEIPFNLFGGCMCFIPWYFMVHFQGGRTGGILWGYLMLYQFFFATLAQALAAIAPNATLASVLFSSLFSFVILFCGVLQPTAQLPYFWRVWMHPLSPLTYIMEGMLGPVLGGKSVRCSASEFQILNPPAEQSCQTYLGAFSTSLQSLTSSNPQTGTGYFIQNENGSCGFCQYRNGDEYLANIGFSASHVGRNFGIVVSYIAFNFFLCLGAYYFFQIASFSLSQRSKKVQKDNSSTNVKPKDEKDHSFDDVAEEVSMLGYTSAKLSSVTGSTGKK